MKSYVYFWGSEGVGLSKASVSLDTRTKKVYYIQDNKVFVTDCEGNTRFLNALPEGQVTAFTHVSADGKKLCVPTSDARTLAFTEEEQEAQRIIDDIDQRVQTEGLNSYIRVYCTETGKELVCEKVEKAWITHVQFSPYDDALILYNHEYCADAGIRRMWLWDGKQHRALRSEDEVRDRADWTCHEMWQPDGKSIIYHGKYNGKEKNLSYIGRVSLDGTDVTEITLPEQYQLYGHFIVACRHDNWLVTDGYYQDLISQEGDWAGSYITLLKIDWDNKKIDWMPLIKHGSSWQSQDVHPHPIFAADDRSIYFTTDKRGKREIVNIGIREEKRDN